MIALPPFMQDAAREMQGIATPMELHLQPSSVLYLVGLVQLASRHPKLESGSRVFAAAFVRAARDYFAACPAVLELIDAGDDPARDV